MPARVTLIAPAEELAPLRAWLSESDDCRVIAEVGLRPASRHSAGQGFPIAAPSNGCFESVRQLLSNAPAPDAAIVRGALPEDLGQLLDAGVDVLVEPPFARSTDAAERLEEHAERLGRMLESWSPPRHSSAFRVACRAIAAGRIGPLRMIDANLSEKPAGEAPSLVSSLAGLAAVEVLGGEIRRVRMTGPLELETRHPGEVRARVRLLADLSAPAVRAVGELGEVTIGNARTLLHEAGGTTVLGEGYTEGEARRAQLDRFLGARRAGDPDPDPGAQMIAWLHAAARSRARARWEWA